MGTTPAERRADAEAERSRLTVQAVEEAESGIAAATRKLRAALLHAEQVHALRLEPLVKADSETRTALSEAADTVDDAIDGGGDLITSASALVTLVRELIGESAIKFLT